MQRKKCARIADDGRVEKTWESATALAREIGTTPSVIHACCRYGWKRHENSYRYLDDDGNIAPLMVEKKPCVVYRKRMLAIIRKHYLPLMGQVAWDWAMERLGDALEKKTVSRNLLGVVEHLMVWWYTHQTEVFIASDDFVRVREETRADMLKQQGRRGKSDETKMELD